MVDIIIRGKNGHELTGRCIESIKRNTPRSAYQLILVDDGSDPPLCGYGEDYNLRHATSRGAVSATNTGLALALTSHGSDYVLVLDNDTEVPEGDTTWLHRFVDELERFGPRCAAVGATTNYANRPQHVLAVPQTYTADWKDESGQKDGSKNQPDSPWFVSFAVLLRKSAIRECGLWDERYNPGNWEDTDYALQLRVRGYSIHVAQSVYIKHKGHSTFGADLKRLLETNKTKFVEKWGPGRLWDLGLIGSREVAMIANEVVRQEAGSA